PRTARRAPVARDRRRLGSLALGRGLPVLAILSARARPRRAAIGARALRLSASGFRQFEELPGIDQIRVTDVLAIGAVDRRITDPFAVDLPSDHPQIVAAPDQIAVVARHRLSGRGEGFRDAVGNGPVW